MPRHLPAFAARLPRFFTLSRLSIACATVTAAAIASGCGGGGGDAAPVSSTPFTQVKVPTLLARSVLPADAGVEGPTSGQYITGGDLAKARAYGIALPLVGKQPIQGFSAVAAGPVAGCYYAMQDNGFGSKASSPDALLHVYAIRVDASTQAVRPADFATCAPRGSFDGSTFIRLRDPDRRLGFALVADGTVYPGTPSAGGAAVAVDPLVRAQRLLTGGDIDIESMVIDADGNFWFGEEFGPFLVKTDRTGKVLQREIPLPNGLGLGANPLVQTASNPYIGTGTANLPTSGGIESLAIDPARTRLFTLLERELSSDTDKQRRMLSVFDLRSNAFLPAPYAYRVGAGSYVNETGATVAEVYTVNDMAAINDHEFLVLEKDRGAGDARTGLFPASGAARVAARYKKVFRVDLNVRDASGNLVKTEVADLMNLADPGRIGGAATLQGVFTFPMESVETVHILDANTILVANDNNFPGGASARDPNKPDGNEFILVGLPTALNLQK